MDYATVRRSFLDLPSEIRNQIYQLSLVSTNPIRLNYSYCPAKNCGHLVSRDKTISTPLLRVCRKLQQEASSFVYAQNRFDFERLLDAQVFLIIIGPANCRFLTRLGTFTITYSRFGRLPWSPSTRPEFALQPFVHKWKYFEDSIRRRRLLQRSFVNSRSYHQYEVVDYEGKI